MPTHFEMAREARHPINQPTSRSPQLDDCYDKLDVSMQNTGLGLSTTATPTDVQTVPQSGSGHGLATTASEQDMPHPETEMSAHEPGKPQPDMDAGRKATTPSLGEVPQPGTKRAVPNLRGKKTMGRESRRSKDEISQQVLPFSVQNTWWLATACRRREQCNN